MAFTKPVDRNEIHGVSQKLLDAEQKFAAGRKLALILKSNSGLEEHISVGEMIEVYQRTGLNRKGVWSAPKIIVAVDNDARSVTVRESPVIPSLWLLKISGWCYQKRLLLFLFKWPLPTFMSLPMEAKSTSSTMIVFVVNILVLGAPKVTTQIFLVETVTVHHKTTLLMEILMDLESYKEPFFPFLTDDSQYYRGTVKHVHWDRSGTVAYVDGERKRLQL